MELSKSKGAFPRDSEHKDYPIWRDIRGPLFLEALNGVCAKIRLGIGPHGVSLGCVASRKGSSVWIGRCQTEPQ